MKIFLDDVRDAPDDSWVICRDSISFYNVLSACPEMIEVVSFDHDLGLDSADGYDCIKMLANDFGDIYPETVIVHSANPVGAENIIRYDEWYRRVRN